MAIMKRATAKAQAFDPSLEVHKGLWGYCASNKTFKKQRCTLVRQTTEAVIADLEKGARPVELKDMVDCPACRDGAVYPTAKAGMWSGLMTFTAKPERCDLCGGTGEVDAKTAAEWEAARLAEEE